MYGLVRQYPDMVNSGIQIARLTLDLDCTCHTYGLGAQSWFCR